MLDQVTLASQSKTEVPMTLARRFTLCGAGATWLSSIVPTLAQPASPLDGEADPRRAERAIGDPSAKVTVHEFFSLTCAHCAAFARTTMPSVEKDLIAPGIVRFVYHDHPLDQVALTAAMVSRYLPPAQYFLFIDALFAKQDHWAFARGINNTEEIWKFAGLAGMSHATFDQAVADADLRDWILEQQQSNRNRWKINATPTFVINDQKYAGELSYDAFRKLLLQT
jgi:protein-disulfide isomerase